MTSLRIPPTPWVRSIAVAFPYCGASTTE